MSAAEDELSAARAALKMRLAESGEPEPGEAPRRRLTFERAASITPTAPEWLWRGWILRRALNLWTGRQGSGKTTLAAHVIATRTTGRPLPGEHDPVEPTVCAILSLEEPADRLVARLTAAGADLERVLVLGDVEDVDDQGRAFRRCWQLPLDITVLGEVVREHGVGLVAVDGLGFSILGDSHNYSVVGQALSALAGEAERTGAAILGLVHPPKGASDPVTAAIGSTAWTAIPRVAAVLGADPHDETGETRVIRVAKSNYRMPLQGVAFRLRNDATYEVGVAAGLCGSDVAAEDITAAPSTSEERGERAEARVLLRELLASGPVDAAEVAKALPEVSRSTLKRARADLGVLSEPRRDATGKVVGWTLRLPESRGSSQGSKPGVQMSPWSSGASGHHQEFYNTSSPEAHERESEPLAPHEEPPW